MLFDNPMFNPKQAIYIYNFSSILDHMKMLIFVAAFFFAVSSHEYPVNQWLSLGALKTLCTVSGLKVLRWWQFFMRKETISDISITKIIDYPFSIIISIYHDVFAPNNVLYIYCIENQFHFIVLSRPGLWYHAGRIPNASSLKAAYTITLW